jgi:hypothetical protein
VVQSLFPPIAMSAFWHFHPSKPLQKLASPPVLHSIRYMLFLVRTIHSQSSPINLRAVPRHEARAKSQLQLQRDNMHISR